MRLHVLPGRRAAADIWKQAREGETVEDRPAYAKLMEDGVLDRCGMTLLAGKAVGAPFVGAIAATLALSEVLRLLHGGAIYQLIDIDLLSLDQRLVSQHPNDFADLRASCETRDRPSFFLAGGGGARDGQRAGCSVRRMAVTAPGKPATRGFMEPACRL